MATGAQEIRNTVRLFREASARRSAEEADALACLEAERRAADDEAAAATNAAQAERVRKEREANDRLPKERAAAEARLQAARREYEKQRGIARENHSAAGGQLTVAGLRWVLYGAKPDPPAPAANGDNAGALAASMAVAQNARVELDALVDRELARRHRLVLLLIATVVAVTVIAIAAVVLIGKQQQNEQRRATLAASEQHYQAAQAGLQAAQWDRARQEIAAIPLTPYKDADQVLQQSYLRPAQSALSAQDWKTARRQFAALYSSRAGTSADLTLIANAVLQGDKSVPFQVTAPEQNVNAPNTHMTITGLEVSGTDVTLDLTITIDSGGGASIGQPQSVTLVLSGGTYSASGVAGLFGSRLPIPQLNIVAQSATTRSGTITFAGALVPFANAGCFELHYGNYFNFPRACLE